MNTPRKLRALAGLLLAGACTLAWGQMDTPAPPGPPAAQPVQRPLAKPVQPPAPPSSDAPLPSVPRPHPGDPQISVPIGKPVAPSAPAGSAPDAPPSVGAERRSMAHCDRLGDKAAVAECRRRAATEGQPRPPPAPY